MPGGAYADEKKKATRCILWLPTPHEADVQSKASLSQADARMRSAGVESEALLPPAPAEGYPLIVLAHGALSHARGPHTLWHAWYLVREHNCAVLSVDHLPHHGVKTPYGSSTAEGWPAADLSAVDSPWAEGEWERTLRRAANELGYAVDIVLALPSAADMARSNAARKADHAKRLESLDAEARKAKGAPVEHDAGKWLEKLAARSRMRLRGDADDDCKPKMIDHSRVGLVGASFARSKEAPFPTASLLPNNGHRPSLVPCFRQYSQTV